MAFKIKKQLKENKELIYGVYFYPGMGVHLTLIELDEPVKDPMEAIEVAVAIAEEQNKLNSIGFKPYNDLVEEVSFNFGIPTDEVTSEDVDYHAEHHELLYVDAAGSKAVGYVEGYHIKFLHTPKTSRTEAVGYGTDDILDLIDDYLFQALYLYNEHFAENPIDLREMEQSAFFIHMREEIAEAIEEGFYKV